VGLGAFFYVGLPAPINREFAAAKKCRGSGGERALSSLGLAEHEGWETVADGVSAVWNGGFVTVSMRRGSGGTRHSPRERWNEVQLKKIPNDKIQIPNKLQIPNNIQIAGVRFCRCGLRRRHEVKPVGSKTQTNRPKTRGPVRATREHAGFAAVG
jgi:hypothetical protein